MIAITSIENDILKFTDDIRLEFVWNLFEWITEAITSPATTKTTLALAIAMSLVDLDSHIVVLLTWFSPSRRS